MHRLVEEIAQLRIGLYLLQTLQHLAAQSHPVQALGAVYLPDLAAVLRRRA